MTVTDDRVQRAISTRVPRCRRHRHDGPRWLERRHRGTAARGRVLRPDRPIDRRVAQRSRELESEGRSESPADVLREQGRRSNRDARAAAGRAETAAQMPTLGDALGDGAITAGHLDAIANATAKLTNIRTWIDRETGMGHIHTELDPESHAKILASLRAKLRSLKHQQDQRPSDDPLAPLTHEQLEADAFIELIIGSDCPRPAGPRRHRAPRPQHIGRRLARQLAVRNHRRHPDPARDRPPLLLHRQHHPRRPRIRRTTTRRRRRLTTRHTSPTPRHRTRCTAPAPSPAAAPPSATARSTTSTNGSTTDPPTSNGCSHSANATTTSSTKAAGTSTSTTNATSPSTDPTARVYLTGPTMDRLAS